MSGTRMTTLPFLIGLSRNVGRVVYMNDNSGFLTFGVISLPFV